MPKSFINNDSEYKMILKSDKEKGAILKLKTRSSKTKKEVTFKTVECEISKDVTCSLEISQTCRHAKEIQGDLHLSEKPGVKSKGRAARYSNGSVVDSEAIGGISVVGTDVEPVTFSVGKRQPKQQSQERSGKPLPLPGARPFRTPQRICGQCGGRQLDAPGAIASDLKSEGEKGVDPLSTTGRSPPIQLEQKLKQSQYRIPEEQPPLSPQLYLSEEFTRKKIGPPVPCPLHSRSASSSRASLPQPCTLVGIAEATAETTPPPCDRLSRRHPTPRMATATKSNTPRSHTYPQNRGIPQRDFARHSVPISVCVSVHAARDSTPSCLYTTASGAGSISITSAQRRTAEFRARTLPPTRDLAVANAKYESQSSVFATKVDRSESKCTQMMIKCHGVSLTPGALEAVRTPLQTLPVSVPTGSGRKPQRGSPLGVVMNSNRLPAISSAPFRAGVHVPLATVKQSAWSQDSDTIPCHSAKPAAPQCRSVQPVHANTKTTLCVHPPTLNAALNSSGKQKSDPLQLSAVAPASTSAWRNAQTPALRDSSTCLETPPPPGAASSSAPTENQTDAHSPAAVPHQLEDGPVCDRGVGGGWANEGGIRGEAQCREPGFGSASPGKDGPATHPPNDRIRDIDAGRNESEISPRNVPRGGGSGVNGNPISKLVSESNCRENSSMSQVTSLRNYISLMKSGGSCLHGCVSGGQRREGCAEHAGQSAPFPPANTDGRRKNTIEPEAVRAEARKPDKDSRDLSADPGGDIDGPSGTLTRLTSAPSSPGPEPPPSETLPNLPQVPESRPRLKSITRPDSKPSPSAPGDGGGAHSHPSDVARLLPPSPHCCRSASLQQKLESVEASLAANKDRITTLLNIIHDLETSHIPSRG